jgi:aldehyde dehydrogenase
MAAWKIAPALAAGNCTVLKPASPAPWSILMQYAAQNIIPTTTELGGKSPNIFFADVLAADDEFLDKAIEGLVLYAFNKARSAPARRVLIQESVYDEFMPCVLDRIRSIKQGHSLDRSTEIGPQVSAAQLEKVESYVQIGLDEGAELLIGGHRPDLNGELAGGYYFEPTALKGTNDMRGFQGGDLRPGGCRHHVQGRARGARDRERHALRPRRRRLDPRRQPRHQGRPVWTNCYHQYPAHAAFGGYKVSGVGRETHKMMLDHYSQTTCLLVSYDPKPLGFF